MGDHATAMALFGAIMLALYQRERTGEGGMVSTSLMAAGLWSNGMLAQAYLAGATVRPRPPREQALNALANLYCAADDRWFMLALLSEEKQRPALLRGLGHPELADDPRFATVAARRAHVRDLVAALDEIFATLPWAEGRARLDAEGITFGGVAKLDDLAADHQMLATGALVPLVDLGGGAILTASSPVAYEGATKVPAGHAPAIGEHTEEILRSAGYDETEIDALFRLGVAGAPPAVSRTHVEGT